MFSLSKKHKRFLFFIIVFLTLSTLLGLILWQLKSNIAFFYTPTELISMDSVQKIRVGGLVINEPKTLHNDDAIIHNFTITDGENEINIQYQGVLPGMFRVRQGVVAQGRYDKKSKTFTADTLLIKHDENYTPPEISSIKLN